jgi:HEAT repeat protein
MNTKLIRRFFVSVATLGLAAVSSSASADNSPLTHAGRATVYQSSSFEKNNSLEAVSTPAAIRALFNKDGNPNYASSRIWQVLEHGEKVECLSCIPLVSGLLYDTHPKTREIAAWWLRRRIFGVFGKGEVYTQVLATLADTSQHESRRAMAANALGEFLSFGGREPLANAIRNDDSALVRQAAVQALERMNTDGPGRELSLAMGDTDAKVRLAALHAATRINVFTDLESIADRIGDEEATVRQAAAAALGTMRVADAVDSLVMLTSRENEPDAAVRKSAVWSLGQIGDSAAADAIRAAENDRDPFVRDAARIAGLRLGL